MNGQFSDKNINQGFLQSLNEQTVKPLLLDVQYQKYLNESGMC